MSSDITTLLNAVAATGAGAQFDLSALARYMGGQSFEVSGTFVGSVDIEASIDAGVTWHVLQTFTDAGGLYSDHGVFTHIRGNVTAWTSGSISLKARYSLLEDLNTLMTTLQTDITTLKNRLTAARATLLDNLTRLDTTISGISATAQLENLIKQLRIDGRTL